ncbi:MAG: hypothetical protein ACTSUE_04875 [Promethearchaeota archaeon]
MRSNPRHSRFRTVRLTNHPVPRCRRDWQAGELPEQCHENEDSHFHAMNP